MKERPPNIKNALGMLARLSFGKSAEDTKQDLIDFVAANQDKIERNASRTVQDLLALFKQTGWDDPWPEKDLSPEQAVEIRDHLGRIVEGQWYPNETPGKRDRSNGDLAVAVQPRRIQFDADVEPVQTAIDAVERKTLAEAAAEAGTELKEIKAYRSATDLGRLEDVIISTAADDTHDGTSSGISFVGNQGIGKSFIQNCTLKATCDDPITYANRHASRKKKRQEMLQEGELEPANEVLYVRLQNEAARDVLCETVSEAQSVTFDGLSPEQKAGLAQLQIIEQNFSKEVRERIRAEELESDTHLAKFCEKDMALSVKYRGFALPSKAGGQATTMVQKTVRWGQVPQVGVKCHGLEELTEHIAEHVEYYNSVPIAESDEKKRQYAKVRARACTHTRTNMHMHTCTHAHRICMRPWWRRVGRTRWTSMR